MPLSHRAAASDRKSLRSANAAVELLLILPVLVLIVLGIVEFARAMTVGQALTDSARRGVQKAVREGASNEQVRQEVQAYLNRSLKVSESDLDVAIEVRPAGEAGEVRHDLTDARPKDLVRVSVKVPFDQVAYVAGLFLGGTTLEGHCDMRLR